MQSIRLKLIVSYPLGALTVLGFAPFYYFPVPVITLALLLFFWRRCASPLQAASLGFSFGMGLFSVGVSWVYISLHEFGGMPVPVAVLSLFLLCTYLSLFPAITGLILAKLRLASPVIWALTAAALWMLIEWLRGTLLTGFPWLAIGYTQVPYSPLAGYAPIMGVYGVSLILVFSAACVFLLFEKRLSVKQPLLLLGAIWIGGFGLQQILWVQPQGEPVTVSLLQGNIAQDLKWQEDYLINTMDIYANLILESESRLIVTPEISIPLFRGGVSPDYLSYLADHARKNKGDVLIGMAEHSADGEEYYNTMFSFGTSPEQLYRKSHLVPFGEFVPLKSIFGWIIDSLDIPLADFGRGSIDQQPLDLAGQRVA